MAIAAMRPGFVRYHSWEAMGDSKTTAQGWIDTKNHAWDAKKILNALAALTTDQSNVLINIPTWPDWMDPNHHGVPDRPADFARWCADLARILVNSPRKVTYLEITNERDGAFYVDLRTNGGWGPPKDPNIPDRISDLAQIYNLAADAVKSVNPDLKVGGPAAARADLLPFAEKFVDLTKDHLDFYSAHAYASGSASDPDQKILTRADQMVDSVKSLKDDVERHAGRPLPVLFDEFNISWTWETRDPRMTNHLGAVFDALILTQAAKDGIAGTAAWNERDGIYGKSSNDGALRPSAYLYGQLNTFGIGKIVQCDSSDSEIATFAIQGQKGTAIWLINRSHDFKKVSGLPGAKATLISDTGMTELQGVTRLPPYSVCFIHPVSKMPRRQESD